MYLESGRAVHDKHFISFFQDTPGGVSFPFKMVALLADLCNATLRDPVISQLLQNPRDDRGQPKYHLVVVDSVFGEFSLSVAHRLGVPAMYLSPSILFPYQAWSLNIPFPLSYVPFGISFTSDPMNFKERAINVFQALTFFLIRRLLLFPKLDSVIHDVLPKTPPMSELERNVSFVLSNRHTALHRALPRMPYYDEIGGVNCKPAKPLPKVRLHGAS